MDVEKMLRAKPMAELGTLLQEAVGPVQGGLSRGLWCLWHLCGLSQDIRQAEDQLCTGFLLPLPYLVLFLLSSCCMEMQ